MYKAAATCKLSRQHSRRWRPGPHSFPTSCRSGGLGPSLSPEPVGSSGLNPSAVVEPESVRPDGAGGAVEPSTKRPRLILRLDAVRTDSSGNELHHVDEPVELVDEAAECFLDCQWDDWDDEYVEDESPLDQIPSMSVHSPRVSLCALHQS